MAYNNLIIREIKVYTAVVIQWHRLKKSQFVQIFEKLNAVYKSHCNYPE